MKFNFVCNQIAVIKVFCLNGIKETLYWHFKMKKVFFILMLKSFNVEFVQKMQSQELFLWKIEFVSCVTNFLETICITTT